MNHAGPRGLLFRCLFFVVMLLFAGVPNAGAQSAQKPGFLFELPPDLVRLDAKRRNPVFTVGEAVSFTLSRADVAVRYEVRNYYGDRVAQGALIGATLVLPAGVRVPGWYKVYLYGREPRAPWGDAVGGTMFVIFRNTPGFPKLPPQDTPSGTYPSEDEPLRGVLGMGPQRTAVRDANKPDEEIARLQQNVALDTRFYLPFDPVRQRALLFAFPNGTAGKEAGVRAVAERFKNEVRFWEPRNEPNYGSSGADFVVKELKPFHDAIKSVDPGLQVIGPGTVSIGPQLRPWLEDFLKAGGARYLDGFSFHAYNTVNGDLWLARTALDSLNALLKTYGAEKLPKWQTEQGFFAAVYGAYQPRLQGRWTLLQMMVYEQYNIPKEHNHLWYDKSHGFWDFPTWWENEDGSLNPAAALMRVWAEELYGTRFVRALRFGEAGDKLYVGSVFASPDNKKRVAAFQSAGSPDGQVNLMVGGGGAKTLRVVSAFGVESRLPVAKTGRVTLTVPELPVYVELAPGQTLSVVPTDWGPNLLATPGVSARASGTGAHPLDKSIPNPISKISNGVLENWYWTQKKPDHPWMDDTPQFPAWVEISLPRPTKIARVIVYASPPWQSQSTLVDYDLQCENEKGEWTTLARVKEPTKTFPVFTPPTRTKVDSFFSDRWVFLHPLTRPVMTRRLRLWVRNTTWGGGATKAVADAGGQTGPHQIVLREVEAYAR